MTSRRRRSEGLKACGGAWAAEERRCYHGTAVSIKKRSAISPARTPPSPPTRSLALPIFFLKKNSRSCGKFCRVSRQLTAGNSAAGTQAAGPAGREAGPAAPCSGCTAGTATRTR